MDLAIITDDWPHDEEDETRNIRKIVGVDGRQKLQIRLRNGVVQWEMEGRPDGTEPYGFPSVLEYSRALSEIHRELEEDGECPFSLDGTLVEELGDELLAYARRRQAFMLMREYEHALRDARHALDILDMVRELAERPSDALRYERRRPELLADSARVEALVEIQRGEFKGALLSLTEGIREIEKFFRRMELGSEIHQCEERRALVDFRRSLRERYHVPLTDGELLQTLQAEQQIAIQQEDYEMAGRLRDKITMLRSRMGASG
jgi:tetratricopeptide (TPR) repeat protein